MPGLLFTGILDSHGYCVAGSTTKDIKQGEMSQSCHKYAYNLLMVPRPTSNMTEQHPRYP